MGILTYLAAAVIGYLCGAIPTGYLVVKQMTGQDIRRIGSGGTGATNVRRVAGGKAALFVMIFDILKGCIPVVIAKALFPVESFGTTGLQSFGLPISWAWLHVFVALMTVLGHSKSVFIGFKGGKSAATGLGSMAGLAFVPALLVGILAFVIVKLTRYQSVGSIAAAFAAPVMLLMFGAPAPYVIYTAVAAALVIYLHKANIGRLMAGTESRL